jgi:hypothetical protein
MKLHQFNSSTRAQRALNSSTRRRRTQQFNVITQWV